MEEPYGQTGWKDPLRRFIRRWKTASPRLVQDFAAHPRRSWTQFAQENQRWNAPTCTPSLITVIFFVAAVINLNARQRVLAVPSPTRRGTIDSRRWWKIRQIHQWPWQRRLSKSSAAWTL